MEADGGVSWSCGGPGPCCVFKERPGAGLTSGLAVALQPVGGRQNLPDGLGAARVCLLLGLLRTDVTVTPRHGAQCHIQVSISTLLKGPAEGHDLSLNTLFVYITNRRNRSLISVPEMPRQPSEGGRGASVPARHLPRSSASSGRDDRSREMQN